VAASEEDLGILKAVLHKDEVAREALEDQDIHHRAAQVHLLDREVLPTFLILINLL